MTEQYLQHAKRLPVREVSHVHEYYKYQKSFLPTGSRVRTTADKICLSRYPQDASTDTQCMHKKNVQSVLRQIHNPSRNLQAAVKAKEWLQQHLPHRGRAAPTRRYLKAMQKNHDQGLNEQQEISM